MYFRVSLLYIDGKFCTAQENAATYDNNNSWHLFAFVAFTYVPILNSHYLHMFTAENNKPSSDLPILCSVFMFMCVAIVSLNRRNCTGTTELLR